MNGLEKAVKQRGLVQVLRSHADIHEGIALVEFEGDPRKNVEVPIGVLREVSQIMRLAADRIEEFEEESDE